MRAEIPTPKHRILGREETPGDVLLGYAAGALLFLAALGIAACVGVFLAALLRVGG